MRRVTTALISALTLVVLAPAASANEYTDVIDAFDFEYGDPFDLNLRVGYERLYKQGKIRREDYDGVPHEWDYYAYRSVAEYKQISHILNLDLDIGLYRDLALKVRVPVILNDSRELTATDSFLSNGGWDGGRELFSLPFKSPERSGLDYIAVGLWWGILDQGRDDTKPNWTVYAEGRFAVGDQLEAACASRGGSDCRDIDYPTEGPNGEAYTGPLAGQPYNTKGGISRGVNELAFGIRMSRRYDWIDPYYGFGALIGWPKEGTAFKITDNAAGQINDMPPVVGNMDFGLEFIPWEVPEMHRKLSIGLGGTAKYHSEGREYTPLFDALGTSEYFLAARDFVDYNGNGQKDAGEGDAVPYWSGMTDVENYASFSGRLFVMVQPAKYVKIKLGTMLGHETEHFITKTDQCPADQLGADGTCVIYNYGHRPELDRPGNRFRVERTFMWSFFADLVAQF